MAIAARMILVGIALYCAWSGGVLSAHMAQLKAGRRTAADRLRFDDLTTACAWRAVVGVLAVVAVMLT